MRSTNSESMSDTRTRTLCMPTVLISGLPPLALSLRMHTFAPSPAPPLHSPAGHGFGVSSLHAPREVAHFLLGRGVRPPSLVYGRALPTILECIYRLDTTQ